ncbi:KH domain-containing, RNA-binding, signal transduction-associated protein 3-like isoform X5 [Chelonus insularis]|uniref:KH domain-containing, RNA-binding, signal transduction-associated protein 3-like isoform X5 n=1 Tax=Chelonus insularis TaxID=460826 RepID=UPI00158C1EA8|nr:KH domain-containing, RNA-binding, signal transduction-associated protein 3-like isoform X5 [Chelonus insularis]
MTDRESNGKYDGDDAGDGENSNGANDSQQRIPLEKQDRDEQDHAVSKADKYRKESVTEKDRTSSIEGSSQDSLDRILDGGLRNPMDESKPIKDQKYVDIYHEKPIRLRVKVLVPVREHPKFNFVGKLLGPKGNSMKRLQEETMCKMAVLGRGSMKDRQKEEELRQSSDPKYAHLNDDLHVEINVLAPPAEAHARIAYALAELRKYLIPDSNDIIRQEQMREMELSMVESANPDDPKPSLRSSSILRSRPIPSPRTVRPPSSAHVMPPPPVSRSSSTRSTSNKSKVFSILDRARIAMNRGYGYEEPLPSSSRTHHSYDYHGSSSSSSRYADRHYSPTASEDVYTSSAYSSYEYDDDPTSRSSDYYETSDYPEDSSGRAWKSYKTSATTGSASRYRSTPYARPK